MFKNTSKASYFHASSVYKRMKGLITAGLFLTGNLVSTLPAIAGPTPSANIVVDTAPPINQRPTIDITHNGIDQVNIVHPNDAGVSHNKFNQYNVHEKGQILNNSPTITNTQLAGQITGNPHLKDGKTANTIINEVTGYSPTKLLGYTEVAGKQAAVIIANPNGITCAGCGFINTSRASLATGRTNLDANGNLQSITVGGGEVGFDGAGGNFAQVPVLDIISRKVRINAPVNGQDIRVIAGRNTYNYTDGTATPLSPDGSQTPEFAIETSALGGMTGNHIQMLVNEKGAGVRVDGRMASTAGDMQLTADGKLVINGELAAQNHLNAHVDIVENTGTIGANNALSMQANGLTNTGKITAVGDQESGISISNNIDNSGSITSRSALKLTASKINNQQSGTIASQQKLTVTGQNLSNNGQISSEASAIQATINGDISNTGNIVANSDIALSAAGNLNNASGHIVANQAGNVTIQSNDLNNQNGVIQSDAGGLGVTVNHLNNNAGSLVTHNGSVNINAQQSIDNSNNGQIGSQQSGNVSLVTQSDLQNSNGKISTGSGDISIQSNKLTNNSGTILAGTDKNAGDVTLRSGDIENSGGVIQATFGSINATMGNYTDSNKSIFYAGKNLQINATGDLSIAGSIQSQDQFTVQANRLTILNKDASISSLNGNGDLTIINDLINNGGISFSQGSLSLSTGSFSNAGILDIGIGGLNFNIKGDFSNKNGSLIADANDVTIIAQGNIDNSNGQIGVKNTGNVNISGQNLNNEGGLIRTSDGDVLLTIATLDNQAGSVLTNNGQLTINALQNILNTSGKIGVQNIGNIAINASGDIVNNNSSSQIVTISGNVQIAGNSLDNSNAQIGSVNDGSITLSLQKNLINTNGKIITVNGNIAVNSGNFTNTNGQLLITDSGDLTLHSGDVENSGGVIQATSGFINTTMGNYTDINKGLLYSGADLQLNAKGDMSVAGAIQGQKGLLLSANSFSLTNTESSLSSLADNGVIHIISTLINLGNIYVNQGSLAVAVGSLVNKNQISTNTSSLSIEATNGGIVNTGSILTQNNDITLKARDQLDNSNGQIGSLNNGNIILQSADLTNQKGLIRTGIGGLFLSVASLNNNDGSILTSQGAVTVNASQGVNNITGKIGAQSSGDLTITANGDIQNGNNGQFVTPSGFVHIIGQNIDNNGGKVGSNDGNISIQSAHLANNAGTILSGTDKTSGDLTLHSGDIENSAGTIQATSGSINATMRNYTDSNSGVFYAGKNLQINATGDMSVSGAIQSQGQLTLLANSLNLTNSKASISSLNDSGSLKIINAFINSGDIYASGGGLDVEVANLSNSGSLYGKDFLKLTVGQNLTNTGIVGGDANSLIEGVIQSDGDISLIAASMLNTGFIQSLNGISLQISGDIQNRSIAEYSGVIQSGNAKDIQITAQNLQNTNGQILSDANLGLNIQNSLTNGGYLQANKALTLTASNLNNNAGYILALGGDLTIGSSQVTAIDNTNGKIQANGNITVYGSSYQSSDQSFLTAQQQLLANFSGNIVNNAQIVAGSGLTLSADSLSNGNSGLLYSSNGNVTLTVSGQNGLYNQGNIQALGDNSQLSVNTPILTNQGVIFSQQGAVFTVNQQLNNQNIDNATGKIITQGGDLTITAPVINNDGLFISAKGLMLSGQGVTNTGYISAGNLLAVNASTITNIQGDAALSFNDDTLASGTLLGDTTQLSAQEINNQSGWIQGNQALTLTANTINNNAKANSDAKSVLYSTNGDVTLQGVGSTADNILPLSSISNNGGNIQAANRLWVATQNLDNTNGILSSEGGDIRLDQGSSGLALNSFANENGTLSSSKDLTLSFSQLNSANGSKILAGGLLSLTIGSDFINNGTLWGGTGLSLILSSLINNAGAIIGADKGDVTIHANNGNVTNYGTVKNLDVDKGNLSIQAQSLTNDNGLITSNSNIDLQLSGALSNQNNGEITAYNNGNLDFTANSLNNAGLMLVGGAVTGTVSGDINNTSSGYIYGAKGLNLTSNTQIVNQGQIGSDTGNLSLTANTINLAQTGQIITNDGNVLLTASSAITNNGWLQTAGDIQITTPMLDNTNGVILSQNGSLLIQRNQNGNGLDLLTNNKGILQSANNLTIYTDKLINQGGAILTYAALSNGVTGDISLYANAQGQALSALDLSNAGIVNGGNVQSSRNISVAAQSAGLSATGTMIANQTLTAVINGDLSNDFIFISQGNIVSQSSKEAQNAGVNLTVNGNYTLSEDGGVTSGRDLSVTANNITNNSVLVAANNMTITTGNLVNNATGLFSSTNNMNITAHGNIDNNQGVIQTDQGSMTIHAEGNVNNIGGLIRTQGEFADISLTANSFENKYWGTIDTKPNQTVYEKTYDTAINAEGQPFAGKSNKEVMIAEGLDTTGWNGYLGEYFYSSVVKMIKVDVPEGMYNQDGTKATGYFYWFLSEGAGNPNSKIVIKGTGDISTLNGTPATIHAGGDLTITTTGVITNNVSHIEAGGNMNLSGSSLDNKGIVDSVTYTLACYNRQSCRYLNFTDSSKNVNPPYGHNDGNLDGNSLTAPTAYVWGSNTSNRGLSGTIVAGGSLIGQFSGEVNNTTIIQSASQDDFNNVNPTLPSGKDTQTTTGTAGKDGLTGPGESNLSSDGSNSSSLVGKENNLPGYSGVTNPQGVDPGLHVTLPGFNASGSTSVNDILSSLTGGQALFKPNPNISNSNGNLNGVSGGNINGSGSANTGNTNINNTANTNNAGNTVAVVNVTTQNTIQRNVNTAAVQSGSNYLIETKPAYTSVNNFYGSQYLLDRLSINGSYMFLGDSGFDTQYIQQQYIQATGQSYPGGTYMTASNAMKTLLDNASSQSGKLGLQFGRALTAEQQAALDEDIVWYVPQVVDGQTILVPQLYLSPKTDVLAGAAIKGKDVSITAGSITNSGLMQGTNSIALTATNGDISNIGGTIKGGNISLNAQNGSVINSNTVNTYLVNGGTSSYLGSPGQIFASGTLGIQASDSITTHGGIIQSGSTLAMSASTINIGAAQLNAEASSVTHASDGTLSFTGNQTKNYGTTIQSGGNAILQTTRGDLTFSGSTLNAEGNVSLSSAGSIGLNAVTDSGFSDVKGKKSGTFTNSSFENKSAYTNEVGSTITSGGQLDVVAKKDVTISGGLAATNDVNVISKEGSITENALTSTSDSYDYHHTKKTGFFGSDTGLSAQVGTKKNTDKNSDSSVIHTGSTIASTGGSVNMSADNGDININGSKVLATQDINMIANNVNFNTVQDKTNGDQYHHDSFTGLTVGVSGLIGNIAKLGLTAANSSGDNAAISAALNGADAAYLGLNAGLGKAGLLDKAGASSVDQAKNAAGINNNLIGVSASVGHQSNKYSSKTSTTTDVGSTVSAGGTVNITTKKDINATASTINGTDVIFNAGGTINLNAGYENTHTESSTSSGSVGLNGSVGVGTTLVPTYSWGGSVAYSNGNTTSSSKTAIDTVVNGSNSVVINNKNGSLNLNGAQISNLTQDGKVSDGSITINTGNLTITTPQNTAKYDSTTVGGGLSYSSLGGGITHGFTPNFGYTGIHNDYASTEETMSGIYAGRGGLDVNVSGTTTLNGGSVTSAANADQSQFATGSLVVNDIHNKLESSGVNANATSVINTATGLIDNSSNTKLENGISVIGGVKGGINVAGLNDKHSTTYGVIGDNITVTTNSVSGNLSRDPHSANGYFGNNFDGNSVNSDLTLQNSIETTLQNYGSLAAKVIASGGSSKKPSDQKTEINNALTNNQIKTEETDTVTDTKPDFKPYPLHNEDSDTSSNVYNNLSMAGNYDHSRPLETACPPCVLVGVGGWELLVTAGLIGGALAANDLQNQMTANPDAGKPTNTGHPPADLSDLPNHTGGSILEQDKNSAILSDPITNTDQGWTETVTANPDAGKGTVVTSTPWLNPDGSLIGQQDKKGVIEVNGNADPNQAAWDFVQKAIAGKEVDRVREITVNGVKGQIIDLKDGSSITYRPTGAASGKTDLTTATVQINNDEAKKASNGDPLKIKFNP